MPIVGFNFTKLTAERKKDQIKGDVKVKNDLVLQSLTTTEVELGGKKQNVLKLTFDFLIEHQPGLGNMILSGFVLFLEAPENTKAILDTWKKDKKMSPQLATVLINAILTRVHIRALELAQSVNLPLHIKLPIVLPKQDLKNYIG